MSHKESPSRVQDLGRGSCSRAMLRSPVHDLGRGSCSKNGHRSPVQDLGRGSCSIRTLRSPEIQPSQNTLQVNDVNSFTSQTTSQLDTEVEEMQVTTVDYFSSQSTIQSVNHVTYQINSPSHLMPTTTIEPVYSESTDIDQEMESPSPTEIETKQVHKRFKCVLCKKYIKKTKRNINNLNEKNKSKIIHQLNLIGTNKIDTNDHICKKCYDKSLKKDNIPSINL